MYAPSQATASTVSTWNSSRVALPPTAPQGWCRLQSVPTPGTASTGTVDPLAELADYCAAEGIWLHVDAAYGGFAVVTEIGRRQLGGIGRADSVSLDAHKWFFQPYEAGCLIVKDVRTLERPFTLRHDVIQDTIWGSNHPNVADRGLQLSRAARSLKLWMSVQTFGMGRIPACRAKWARTRPPCRGADSERSDPRVAAPGLAQHRLLPSEPRRPRRGHPSKP